MRFKILLRRALLLALLVAGISRAHAAETPALASPYIFTDEPAIVKLAAPALAAVPYELKTITRGGYGPTRSGSAVVTAGTVRIAPLAEGIHILQLKSEPPQTVRFLAFAPPPRLDKNALRRTLPQSYAKLVEGRPFNILSMGDSVTNTGDYESMLVKMLARATGNRNITFVDRSYPGRSIDASVREWQNDGPPNKPDLGLIMYGLNDQITNVPLDAFLEQYAWLAMQLKGQKADCVFLQPTPDIGIPVTAALRKPDSNDPSYIARTLGFGEALRPLARQLKLPLAETFAAVWGNGGGSLEESARSMWPLFPPGYSNQFQSLLETNGEGDTIHPNALGHLQIARSVFNALAGAQASSPWQWSAQTAVGSLGIVSRVTGRNTSHVMRAGRIEAIPPTDAHFESAPVAYALAPGESIELTVVWAPVGGMNLDVYPLDRYLTLQTPLVYVADFTSSPEKGRSRLHGVVAPFEWLAKPDRKRLVVTGGRVTVDYDSRGTLQSQTVAIDAISDVGRIPIPMMAGKGTQKFSSLSYLRFGAARTGEAAVDGELNEWANAIWSPLGEPAQARSWKGPFDNRSKPEEAYLHWAFKAGKEGVYLSAKATGDLARDSFTIFFDTRAPELLGTVGRYYWVGGKLLPDGRLDLGKGETSATAPGLKGAWKPTAAGANLEIFVPYAALDSTAWPHSGDLGLSIVWTHVDAAGKRTDLLWSENGHWWNPRWYGVVRRTDDPNPQLPYRVRVN